MKSLYFLTSRNYAAGVRDKRWQQEAARLLESNLESQVESARQVLPCIGHQAAWPKCLNVNLVDHTKTTRQDRVNLKYEDNR